MQGLWIDKTMTYNGSQLSSLFAYRTFKIPGDSVVGFQGRCHVDLKEMVDMEDVLANAPVRADNMLHFLVEHFTNDLTVMVTRQRLLVVIIKETIKSLTGIDLTRQGDDLYYNGGKLSVSIATLSPVSGLIHTGLNVTNAGTPVKTASLADLDIADVRSLAKKIIKAYVAEIESMDRACCKVRGVQ